MSRSKNGKWSTHLFEVRMHTRQEPVSDRHQATQILAESGWHARDLQEVQPEVGIWMTTLPPAMLEAYERDGHAESHTRYGVLEVEKP